MLTVADALQLEAFAGSKVVAGQSGLHQPVAWVHVVGVPDAARWLNGGELVLTTAINLPPDAESQCDYVQALADKGVAGLVLSVGRFISSIPAHMRDVAESNHFPLIELPYQTPFVDITRAANEHILLENMTRALHINRVLTQLVLDGGDLQQLAGALANLIEHSVSIENERFEALASANIADFDEARRYTLSEGRTNPQLVEALEDRDVLGQIQRTRRPVFIPKMPDVGLEMERILAPVVVHGDIYGYMWIIAHERPLSDLDHMAIESGATIAALMLLHQEAVQSAEASLKGSLLSQLIDGVVGREAVLIDQALRFGFDLAAPFALLLIEDRGASKLLQLVHRVNRIAQAWTQSVMVGQFAGQVVMVAHAESDNSRLVNLIAAHANGSLRIGISATHRGANEVAAAYQQCREALYIAQRLSIDTTAVYFSDMGYLHTLYQAGTDSLASNPHVPGARKLLDEQQADLFNTLETYLDAGANAVATAEIMHIHRSTLNYRLKRIEEICVCDLSNAVTRTNLQVALKLIRLFL